MDISKITILIEEGRTLAVLTEMEEMLKVFQGKESIAPDNIFDFEDSVWVTDNICLNIVDKNRFEVKIYVKFVCQADD